MSNMRFTHKDACPQHELYRVLCLIVASTNTVIMTEQLQSLTQLRLIISGCLESRLHLNLVRRNINKLKPFHKYLKNPQPEAICKAVTPSKKRNRTGIKFSNSCSPARCHTALNTVNRNHELLLAWGNLFWNFDSRFICC